MQEQKTQPTNEELIAIWQAAKKARKAQVNYFRFREKTDLIKAKQAECDLDLLLTNADNKDFLISLDQKSLF